MDDDGGGGGECCLTPKSPMGVQLGCDLVTIAYDSFPYSSNRSTSSHALWIVSAVVILPHSGFFFNFSLICLSIISQKMYYMMFFFNYVFFFIGKQNLQATFIFEITLGIIHRHLLLAPNGTTSKQTGRRGQSQVTYFSYKLLSLGSSLSKYWRIYPVVLLRMCQLSMVYIWWIMSHSMWWDAAQNLKSKRNSVSKHFLWSPLDILQGRTKIYDSVSHYWPDILQHLSFKLYDVFIVVTAFHQIESVILLFVVLCILWLIFPSSLSEFWILSISQYPNGELGYKTI